MSEEVQKTPEKFTADQWKLIEWLALPKYERTPPNMEMLAASIGVHERTLWTWKKLDGLQGEVNKLARQSIGHKLPEVYGALLREAEKGEFQHIQLILELTGEYVRKQHNVNQSDVKGDLTIHFVEAEVRADDE